ncbi:hypothetical protein DFJ77DRAFT_542643 [Powellomyces hirtus]|nr:hypothetical protein DFJ77DRAFT_542643 [Powellomyces hirtus]
MVFLHSSNAALTSDQVDGTGVGHIELHREVCFHPLDEVWGRSNHEIIDVDCEEDEGTRGRTVEESRTCCCRGLAPQMPVHARMPPMKGFARGGLHWLRVAAPDVEVWRVVVGWWSNESAARDPSMGPHRSAQARELGPVQLDRFRGAHSIGGKRPADGGYCTAENSLRRSIRDDGLPLLVILHQSPRGRVDPDRWPAARLSTVTPPHNTFFCDPHVFAAGGVTSPRSSRPGFATSADESRALSSPHLRLPRPNDPLMARVGPDCADSASTGDGCWLNTAPPITQRGAVAAVHAPSWRAAVIYAWLRAVYNGCGVSTRRTLTPPPRIEHLFPRP